MSRYQFVVLGIAAISSVIAGSGSGNGNGSGGGGGNGGGGNDSGVTAPNAGEVRTLSEKIPAGGTVQVKYLLTQPRPITGGGPRMLTYGFSVNGIAAPSPLGDTAGVGLVHDGFLDVSIVSPDGDYGTSDYPFLMVAMTIPASTPAGSTFPLDILAANYMMPTGPLVLTDPKPGVLTVGGSVSVNSVTPGGGIWPAGTVIHVQGSGFRPDTKLTTKMKTSAPVYVSPNEFQFVLSSTTALDSQPVTLQNPDGSIALYYSYLRGAMVNQPSKRLLRNVEPIFQAITHGIATVGPMPELNDGQYMAVAVQNPTPGPAVVSFHHEQSGLTTSVLLPSGGRLLDDLSSLLDGMKLSSGDVITLNATSGVQIIGMTGDDAAGTVTPWLPRF